MFANDKFDAEIKVIDFGLSKICLKQDETLTDRVGTLYTMAPEVIKASYTTKADMWSVGVIAYMLLSGKKPFWANQRDVIISKIMKGQCSFDGPRWRNISNEAKQFVKSLLKVDPNERLSAEQAFDSPWIAQYSKNSNSTRKEGINASIYESLLKFSQSNDFKKRVFMIIAFMSTSEEICQLRQAFESFDIANDGCIHFEEFKLFFVDCCISIEDLHTIFNSADVNHDGCISYTEFLAATLENKEMIGEDKLAEAFDRLDMDNTGFITKKVRL